MYSSLSLVGYLVLSHKEADLKASAVHGNWQYMDTNDLWGMSEPLGALWLHGKLLTCFKYSDKTLNKVVMFAI